MSIRDWVCGVLIGTALMQTKLEADEPAAESDRRVEWAIAVHGGAGSDPESFGRERREAVEASLKQALQIGSRLLAEGGSSLDAVEQVVRHLEDDPLFNAGRGSVFNAEGGHELDASIMDGRDRSCGGVAGVTTVKNPISLARLVMTKTQHVLLAGPGADRFAEEMGAERVEPSYFSTPLRREQFERTRQQPAASDAERGTVGCVALDKQGNLAAATSTGGRNNKMFGRIGDSPIVGAGTYADNATCAISCTGVGEHYIRHAIAYDVSARIAYRQQALDDAVRAVIEQTLKPGDGGLIAVGSDGQISLRFNTPAMARAAADSSGYTFVASGR